MDTPIDPQHASCATPSVAANSLLRRQSGTTTADTAQVPGAGPAPDVMNSSAPDGQSSNIKHYSDRYAQCYEFLQNVKSRFGEHSKQSVIIHNVLGEFKFGRIPKEHVRHTILGQLGDRVELVENFNDILGVDDSFMGYPGSHHQQSAPSPPISNVSPDFLQPQHQPHLPMPSMSAFGGPEQYSQRLQHTLQACINPELLRAPTAYRDMAPYQQAFFDPMSNGYDNRHSYQPTYTQSSYDSTYTASVAPNMASSPATQATMQLPGFNQHTSPSLGHMQPPAFSSYGTFEYGLHPSSPARGTNAQPKPLYSPNNSWEYENTWTTYAGYEAAATGRHFNPPTFWNEQSTPPLNSYHQSTSTATPFQLGTPIAVPLGQPAVDMLSLKIRNRKETQALSGYEEEQKYDEESRLRRPSAPATRPTLPNQSTQPSSARLASVRTPRSKGQYVHSICGRIFTSRYSVKKHHWGTKTDDLGTVTGCWAKNGKPNVQWDEDPSCRDEPTPKGGNGRSHQPETSQTAAPEHRAPTVPTMVSNQRNTPPGVPILDGFPKTVTETLKRSPTSPQFPKMEALPYHTSQLPIKVGLDTLLTAVIVASKIDAPTPQGRNDSVVSRWDAQAAAAEELWHQPSSWLGGPPEQSNTVHSCNTHQIPPVSEVGLGVMQAQKLDPAVSSNVPICEQQTEQIANPEAGPSMVADENHAQVKFEVQLPAGMASALEERANRKRKRRTQSSISKRELKMLGLKPSPDPEYKM